VPYDAHQKKNKKDKENTPIVFIGECRIGLIKADEYEKKADRRKQRDE
jgi:hypothetical protein